MKVLLLDDHALVRSALESVIQSMDRTVSVLSAGSAAQARAHLAGAGPVDLALLDLHIPDGDGFSLMAEWRRAYPDMPVVIVSASEDPGDVMRALDEGALGFIPKRTANEVLVHALKMVLSGGIYVPPLALRMGQAAADVSALSAVVQAHEPPVGSAALPGSIGDRAISSPGARREFAAAALGRGRAGFAAVTSLRLTPRQSEVLELLLQGQPNKLIARQLNLSVETVKDHVASLLRVLGVSSRTQAVLAVSQMMATPVAPPAALAHAASAAARPGSI